MAWMISLLVGTSVLMSRSVAVSRMFGTTVGMVMTEQSYKTFLSPLSKQRTPLQACITWMTWAQPMFCASCGKSCRDNLAVNGRKELTGLGVTRDRQPTSTTYASLCPKKPTWWQTQSTWRKASADQRIQLTSTASRTKTRVGEERKNSANLATKNGNVFSVSESKKQCSLATKKGKVPFRQISPRAAQFSCKQTRTCFGVKTLRKAQFRKKNNPNVALSEIKLKSAWLAANRRKNFF